MQFCLPVADYYVMCITWVTMIAGQRSSGIMRMRSWSNRCRMWVVALGLRVQVDHPVAPVQAGQAGLVVNHPVGLRESLAVRVNRAANQVGLRESLAANQVDHRLVVVIALPLGLGEFAMLVRVEALPPSLVSTATVVS